MTITVTLYTDLKRPDPAESRAIEWSEFVSLIPALGWLKAANKNSREYRSKNALPLWSPARLYPGKSRSNGNVEMISALVLDYDKGVGPEDIEAVWGDWLMAAHTTWGHRPDSPRCRLVLPLSREVDTSEYARLIRWALRRTDRMGLPADTACKDASRAWFLPAPNPDHVSSYRYVAYYEDDAPVLDVDGLVAGSVKEANVDTTEEAGNFVTEDGEEVSILAWAEATQSGAKLKGYCPFQEDSSPGAAFIRRCQDGVLLVCMSERHGHPQTPMKWFWKCRGVGNMEIATDQFFQGVPELSVMNLLEQRVDRHGNLTGVAKNTRRNVYHVLKNDSRWKSRIWLNEFRGSLMLEDREYRDTDDTRLHLWLDQVYGINIASNYVPDLVRLIGEENGVNPLTDYLTGLDWDGSKRADDWLVRALGAEDTPLFRDLGKRWLIQAVARALRPGCKADTVLILVGPQGAKKSTAFRVLAGDDYFSDTPMDIGSVNAYTQIRRVWVYEVAELDSIRRSANSATKAFLSAQEDTYRPAYGRHAVTVPRHTCFCGTTNNNTFLNDPTGSRRFWPVKVGEIDLTWININKHQLWAEAVALYQAGERWWLTQEADNELAAESEQYSSEDPWLEIIATWASSRVTSFSTHTVLTGALALENHQMTRSAEMRVGDILGKLGFSRVRKMVEGARSYFWTRPGTLLTLPTSENQEGYY